MRQTGQPMKTKGVTTLAGARKFVLAAKLCGIFPTKGATFPSLWTAVALPEKQPGEKGWGKKMVAVWTWKTELPARYPDEIFYGKVPSGAAVLMSISYLRATHYPKHARNLRTCSPLAQRLYELIRNEPYETGPLRTLALQQFRCTKGAFERALKELQITLNIVRSNDPKAVSDTWLTFKELYPDICRELPVA